MKIRENRRGTKLVLALAIVGLVAVAIPATAGPLAPLSGKLVCAATGTVNPSVADDTTADTVTWSLRAVGVCTGDRFGPYIATTTGTGVSTDLGFCDDLVAKDLALAVSIELVSLSRGTTTTINQTWFAPVTTFPIATPFFVRSDADALVGAGSIFTRYAAKCPPGGSPVANFAWAFIKA